MCKLIRKRVGKYKDIYLLLVSAIQNSSIELAIHKSFGRSKKWFCSVLGVATKTTISSELHAGSRIF